MQTATYQKGSKIARIVQLAENYYRVIVSIVSDINEFGDVQIIKNFSTPKGALRFVDKEFA